MTDIVINILVFFLLSISVSLLFFSYLADPKETGAGFFNLVYSISSASFLLSFFALLKVYGTGSPYAYYCLILGGITFLIRFVQKDKRTFIDQILILTVLLGSFYLCFLFLGSNIHHLIILMSSLLFLGIITYSMIMGHWYLVTPKLSERPLLNATYITWGLILLKISTSIYFFTISKDLFSAGTSLGGGYIFNWIMLLMRYGWGYLIVFIMSIFSYKLIKMRSLQSATGLLYAETFFIFTGELISLYFFFAYGVLL